MKSALYPETSVGLGIDRSGDPVRRPPGSFNDLMNCIINLDGSKSPRGGLDSYFKNSAGALTSLAGGTGLSITTAGPIYAIGQYRYGNKRYLMWSDNTGIRTRVTNDPTSNLDTTKLVFKVPLGITQFNRHLVLTRLDNTYGHVALWDGGQSIVTAAANSPICRYTNVFYNRLVAAGNAYEPDLFYISFVGNPNSWEVDTADPDAAAFIGQIPGGAIITAISPEHYGSFYLSSDRGIHRISGRMPSEYQHQQVSHVGQKLGHRTIVNIGHIIGWNSLGCHAISDTDRSGQVETGILSPKIIELFNELAVKDADQYFSVVIPDQSMYITFMPCQYDYTKTVAFVLRYDIMEWTYWMFEFPIKCATVIRIHNRDLLLIGHGQYNLVGYLLPGQLYDWYNSINNTYVKQVNISIETNYIPVGHDGQAGNVMDMRLRTGVGASSTLPVTSEIWSMDSGKIIVGSENVNASPYGFPILGSTFRFGTSKLYDRMRMQLISLLTGGTGRIIKIKISGALHNIKGLRLYDIKFRTSTGDKS